MAGKFLPLIDKRYSLPYKLMNLGKNASILLGNYQRNHRASRRVQSRGILIQCCQKATSGRKGLKADHQNITHVHMPIRSYPMCLRSGF